MTLLSLVLMLIVVGILLWAVNTYLPLDPKIKTLLNIVVVVVVIVWILQVTGLLGPLESIRIR
jgi:hypothetical protein